MPCHLRHHCWTITLRLGRSRLTPSYILRNILIKWCIPKDIPSTGPLYADNAATYTLIVEQDKPCSKRLCKKSKRSLKVQSWGTISFSSHHWEKAFHLPAYARRVEGAHAFSSVCSTPCEHSNMTGLPLGATLITSECGAFDATTSRLPEITNLVLLAGGMGLPRSRSSSR